MRNPTGGWCRGPRPWRTFFRFENVPRLYQSLYRDTPGFWRAVLRPGNVPGFSQTGALSAPSGAQVPRKWCRRVLEGRFRIKKSRAFRFCFLHIEVFQITRLFGKILDMFFSKKFAQNLRNFATFLLSYQIQKLFGRKWVIFYYFEIFKICFSSCFCFFFILFFVAKYIFAFLIICIIW